MRTATTTSGELEFLKVGTPPELVPRELPFARLEEAKAELLEYWSERAA